jgi:hypothetical protein
MNWCSASSKAVSGTRTETGHDTGRFRGTDGSNPAPSREESTNLWSLNAGLYDVYGGLPDVAIANAVQVRIERRACFLRVRSSELGSRP